MTTRFYLPSNGSAAVSPTISATDWLHINTVRRKMSPTKANSALTSISYSPDGADHIVAGKSHFAQFVSDPISPINLAAATAVMAVKASETNAGNNLFVNIKIYITNTAGDTVLGTLLAVAADNTEVGTSEACRAVSIATSAFNLTQVGRLVLEIGLGGTPVATSQVQGHNGTINFGDNAASDLPSGNDTSTSAFNPWLEITGIDFTFAADRNASAAQTVEAFGQSAAGDIDAVGAANQAAGLFQQVAAGGPVDTASANQAIATFDQTATGIFVDERNAAASQTIPAFGQAAVGDADVVGSATHSIATFANVETAATPISASAAHTIASFGHTATGLVPASLTSSQAIASFGQAASALTDIDGASTQSIASFANAAAGDIDVVASATHTIAAFAKTEAGDVDVAGTAAHALASFASSAIVANPISGVQASQIPVFPQVAGAGQDANAAGSQAIPMAAQSAQAQALVGGSSSKAIPEFGHVAAGIIPARADVAQIMAAFNSAAEGAIIVKGSAAEAIPDFLTLIGLVIWEVKPPADFVHQQEVEAFWQNFSGKSRVSAYQVDFIPDFDQQAIFNRVVQPRTKMVAGRANSGSGAHIMGGASGRPTMISAKASSRADIQGGRG